jgi:Flp pilus assembly protein TadD
MASVILPLALIKGYDEAASLLNAEKVNDAIEKLVNLSKQHPTFSGSDYRLARIHLSQKNYEQALLSIDKSIAINPKNYYALNLKGVIHRELGQFEQAKQAYLDSIKVYPEFAEAQLNLGILADIYIHDFELALTQYQTYLNMIEEDQQVSGWLVDLQRRAKQE